MARSRGAEDVGRIFPPRLRGGWTPKAAGWGRFHKLRACVPHPGPPRRRGGRSRLPGLAEGVFCPPPAPGRRHADWCCGAWPFDDPDGGTSAGRGAGADGISGAAGQVSRPIPRRRHQRRARPHRGRQAHGEMGPAHRDREQNRRRRQYRGRRRRPGGARRLHPVRHGAGPARHQPEPLPGALLQARRLRPHHGAGRGDQPDHRAPRHRGRTRSRS